MLVCKMCKEKRQKKKEGKFRTEICRKRGGLGSFEYKKRNGFAITNKIRKKKK